MKYCTLHSVISGYHERCRPRITCGQGRARIGTWAGVAQLVEHLLPKQRVVGSNPISRSNLTLSASYDSKLTRCTPKTVY